LEFAAGKVKVPTGPGLGIEVDRKALERYKLAV
jgi:L-alanine-DL-glutamate epimerase-like enolase superfamily enzyme